MEANFEKMTPELRAYLDYDSHEPGSFEERKRLKALVQPGLVREYYRAQKGAVFAPENEVAGSRREVPSPSGKYVLSVACFSSKAGGWSYAQGKVFAIGSDTPIATVNRNYGAFPSLFIECHPNGHDYLVCGEDYQGQTVVELDTGRRRDFLPEEAEEGHGFCWAGCAFHAETKILVVDGCHWACPYEFRFYDFSDPMRGWPELENEVGIEQDAREPTFGPDGTIKCYRTETAEGDDEDEPKKEWEVLATTTFRREGLRLVLVEEWVSEREKEARARREEGSRRYEQWLSDFKANDPLYLLMKASAAEAPFKPEDHIGVGQTHDQWHPTEKFSERRMCRRIHYSGKDTIDVEWGVDSAPVKLVVYRDGKHVEDRWFDHSVAGMAEALAYARSVLR